jgi:hypothetical protein
VPYSIDQLSSDSDPEGGISTGNDQTSENSFRSSSWGEGSQQLLTSGNRVIQDSEPFANPPPVATCWGPISAADDAVTSAQLIGCSDRNRQLAAIHIREAIVECQTLECHETDNARIGARRR